MTTTTHYSDCATNNAPALPVGPCDCNGQIVEATIKWIDWYVEHHELLDARKIAEGLANAGLLATR